MKVYVIFFMALLLWNVPAFGELSQEEIQAIGNAAAAHVKTELSEIKTELSAMKAELSAMKVELSAMKAELSETKVELSAVRTELSETRAEVSEMKGEIRGQSQRITDQRNFLIALVPLVLAVGGFLYRQLNKLQESVQKHQETIAVLQATYERLKPQSVIQQGAPLKSGNTPYPADVYNNRSIAYAEKGLFDLAIQEANKAIGLKPDYADAYSNRGKARMHLGKWDKAKADLTVAKAMGLDIINSFQNDYENVEDFEQKNGVQVPPDIKEMLTRE